MKPHQDGQDEPFFITEEIEAEMIAAGYVFEPPAHVSTVRLHEILAGLSDAKLAAWPASLGSSQKTENKAR